MTVLPRFRTHVGRHAVAYLALFFALGGGVSWAAHALPRNSVGTKQLRKGSVTRSKLHSGAVTGSKVAAHSLTGKQINSATLGTVPSAGHALGAGSAGNGARRIDFQGAPVDQPPANAQKSPAAHVVFKLDELTIQASCIDVGGGGARLYVTFTSSVAAHLNWSGLRFNNPGTVTDLNGLELGPGINQGPTFRVLDMGGNNVFETGDWVYRNGTRTITATLHAGAEDLDPGHCDIEGTAVAAPG